MTNHSSSVKEKWDSLHNIANSESGRQRVFFLMVKYERTPPGMDERTWTKKARVCFTLTEEKKNSEAIVPTEINNLSYLCPNSTKHTSSYGNTRTNEWTSGIKEPHWYETEDGKAGGNTLSQL